MKVLISGAGIAGLSLALRLRQRGRTPVIVERSPGLHDGGYMLGLSDPGLDAAERMGVPDALRAAWHRPRRLVYVDRDGRERFTIPAAGAAMFGVMVAVAPHAMCSVNLLFAGKPAAPLMPPASLLEPV